MPLEIIAGTVALVLIVGMSWVLLDPNSTMKVRRFLDKL